MSHYLITGCSGTGKSTLCDELVAHSYLAFDGDSVPGLARWIDVRTGHQANIDYSKPIERERYAWNWDGAILDALLVSHPDIFLCGSADNQLEFHSRFDKVFVLTLPADQQRLRIRGRTSHNYGKQPGMEDIIIAEQEKFVEQALQLGAVAVDANPQPKLVVKTILEQAGLGYEPAR